MSGRFCQTCECWREVAGAYGGRRGECYSVPPVVTKDGVTTARPVTSGDEFCVTDYKPRKEAT